jgi:Tfp pilus assembly protein PilN
VRPRSARERILLIAGGAALAAFLLLFFLVLPMRDRGVQLASRASELNREIERADALRRQMPKMKQEIGSLNRQVHQIVRTGEDIAPDIVREIEDLTGDLKVRLTSVTPKEPEALPNHVKYYTTLEVESDIAGVVKLLYALEQPAHQLWVEGVRITRPAGGQLRATIHVAAYTLERESEKSDAKT